MAQSYVSPGNAALVRKRIGATTLPGQPLNQAMRPRGIAEGGVLKPQETAVAAPGSAIQPVTGSLPTPITPMVPQPQPPAPGGAVQAPTSGIQPIIGSNGSLPAPITPMLPQPQPQSPKLPGSPNDFLTDFGPGNDLRGTQINPMASDRLGGVAGQVDQAAGALSGAPDRGQLATDYFKQMEEAGRPQFESDLRNVGRRAAALGRLGAGMTTSELGDVTSNRERDLSLARRGLATDAASRSMEDRLGTFGALSGLEGDLSGREAGRRDELRGERGYQGGLAQEDIQNQIQQRMLQEALTQGSFGRAATRAGLGLRSAEMDSEQAGNTTDAVLELIRSGALRRSQRTGG